MIDFDLEVPLEKILTNMLDKVEGHAVGCKCIDCNSLEVLAFMIMEKPEVIEFEEDR